MPFAVTNQTIGAAGTLEDSFVAPTASRPNDFTPLNPSVVNVVNVAIAPPAPTTGTLATTIEYAQGIVSESVAEYGVQETPVVITLLETLEDAALLAEYLIRSAPAFWFGNIQIIMNGLTDAQRTIINSLDIGSQVSVTKSFPKSTPSTVTQLMALEGISHDITPDRHIVTLYPNPARIYTYFIVGGYTTFTTRTNLVTNPSFETNTSLWTPVSSTLTRVAGTFGSGAWVGQCVSTITAFDFYCTPDSVTVSGGTTLTASATVLRTVGTRNYIMYFNWFNGATFLSQTRGTANACSTATRLSVTGTAPATTTRCRVVIAADTSGAIGDAFQFDSVLCETGSSSLPYFDGTYADTYTGYTLTAQGWNGTANASTSTGTWGLDSAFVGSQLDDDTKGLG